MGRGSDVHQRKRPLVRRVQRLEWVASVDLEGKENMLQDVPDLLLVDLPEVLVVVVVRMLIEVFESKV